LVPAQIKEDPVADLSQLAAAHLAAAQADERGRSPELLVHDGPLRQTIIALVAGTELAEHNSPDAASMQVLLGRVRVTGQETVELGAGKLSVLTHHRHSVRALEDSVFLLTTVTSVGQTAEPQRGR